MSRTLELTLKHQFSDFAAEFIRAFPRSYSTRGCDPSEYGLSIVSYRKAILENVDEIFRAAAAGISNYLNLYAVRAAKSADEYKIIYFLGVAIERRLQALGLAELAQVHMYAMIGLLDYRLRMSGIDKPTLRKALTKLVRQNQFFEQLGVTGGYLIFKTVSTTPDCMGK